MLIHISDLWILAQYGKPLGSTNRRLSLRENSHRFLCREQTETQRRSSSHRCQCVSSGEPVCSSLHCPLQVCSWHHAVGAAPTRKHAPTHVNNTFVVVFICLVSVLTFDLRNFLVSLWTRLLSVSRFSDGSRVSFSLWPCSNDMEETTRTFESPKNALQSLKIQITKPHLPLCPPRSQTPGHGTHRDCFLTLSNLFSMNSTSTFTASMLTPMYSTEPCCTLGSSSTSRQGRGRFPSRLTVWLEGAGREWVKCDVEGSIMAVMAVWLHWCGDKVCCPPPTCGTPQSAPLHLHGSLNSVSLWLLNVCTLLPPPTHTHTHTL